MLDKVGNGPGVTPRPFFRLSGTLGPQSPKIQANT